MEYEASTNVLPILMILMMQKKRIIHMNFSFQLQAMFLYHLAEICDSSDNVSDVEMTSPAHIGGNAYYINFRGASNLEYARACLVQQKPADKKAL